MDEKWNKMNVWGETKIKWAYDIMIGMKGNFNGLKMQPISYENNVVPKYHYLKGGHWEAFSKKRKVGSKWQETMGGESGGAIPCIG